MPTFTIKINHSWIGKYTVCPKDGMGYDKCLFLKLSAHLGVQQGLEPRIHIRPHLSNCKNGGFMRKIDGFPGTTTMYFFSDFASVFFVVCVFCCSMLKAYLVTTVL